MCSFAYREKDFSVGPPSSRASCGQVRRFGGRGHRACGRHFSEARLPFGHRISLLHHFLLPCARSPAALTPGRDGAEPRASPNSLFLEFPLHCSQESRSSAVLVVPAGPCVPITPTPHWHRAATSGTCRPSQPRHPQPGEGGTVVGTASPQHPPSVRDTAQDPPRDPQDAVWHCPSPQQRH